MHYVDICHIEREGWEESRERLQPFTHDFKVISSSYYLRIQTAGWLLIGVAQHMAVRWSSGYIVTSWWRNTNRSVAPIRLIAAYRSCNVLKITAWNINTRHLITWPKYICSMLKDNWMSWARSTRKYKSYLQVPRTSHRSSSYTPNLHHNFHVHVHLNRHPFTETLYLDVLVVI